MSASFTERGLAADYSRDRDTLERVLQAADAEVRRLQAAVEAKVPGPSGAPPITGNSRPDTALVRQAGNS